MIDCDQAFDCMTDAARRESPELRDHLKTCPRCRQMSETLAPALDLLSGPVPPWMQAEPVSGSSTPSATAVQVAQRTSKRLQRWNQSPFQRWGSPILAGLVGAAAGLVAMAVVPPPKAAAPTGVPPICTWKDRDTAPPRDARTLTLSCVVCHLERDRNRTAWLPGEESSQPIVLAGSAASPRSLAFVHGLGEDCSVRLL